MDEERVDRILQPADLEMAAVERAILDFRARVIGHALASHLAIDLALVGELAFLLARARHEQVARAAIHRHRILGRRDTRAFDDGLVVAGEEAGRVADLGDAQGQKVLLEERARLLRAGGRVRLGPAADALHGLGETARRRLRLVLRQNGAAARQEGRIGGGVIVGAPAVEQAPGGGLERRFGKFERARFRAGRTGYRQAAGYQQAKAKTEKNRRADHCPASVATSFQLGSREDRSRAKVHTSVTSVTRSGAPSITSPPRLRVTEMSCDTKRTVTWAVRVRSSAPTISALSIDTKRVSTVSPRCSRSRMAVSKPS